MLHDKNGLTLRRLIIWISSHHNLHAFSYPFLFFCHGPEVDGCNLELEDEADTIGWGSRGVSREFGGLVDVAICAVVRVHRAPGGHDFQRAAERL